MSQSYSWSDQIIQLRHPQDVNSGLTGLAQVTWQKVEVPDADTGAMLW